VAITCLILMISLRVCSVSAETTDKKKAPSSQTDGPTPKEPYKPIALQDSVKKSLHQNAQAAREKYWQKTLAEIQSLNPPKPKPTKTDLAVTVNLNRWKRFATTSSLTAFSTSSSVASKSDDTKTDNEVLEQQPLQEIVQEQEPERYNGYFSWERLLQEWSDDIQEYLDKIEAEGKRQYPMSTFGIPKEDLVEIGIPTEDSFAEKSSNYPDDAASSAEQDYVGTTYAAVAAVTADASEATVAKPDNLQTKVTRPIPAPRKENEAVLPHTDISDKSKRVWIVTTAALPWMTGTAVNPLLRAAYMTNGRKAAGGSVTLLLPWLERQEDQDNVYGAGKSFATPEDQEAHIRGWLKNSAKMDEASEELNIKWYTAWQNKIENSVYSMGDMVANISEDEVDICVLEEPEHLNWSVSLLFLSLDVLFKY
jgi:hypothetical protein